MAALASGDSGEAACPHGEAEAVLFLVGDAGGAREPEPALEQLAADVYGQAQRLGRDRVAVAFLGDLIYPRGLPETTAPDFPEAARRLEAQLRVLRRAGVRGYLVPGNHDWGGRDQGFGALLRLERHLERVAPGLASLHPGGGCPGPEWVDLGAQLRLVFLDTHWWLHRGARPEHPDSACPADSEEEVEQALRALLQETPPRRAVVMAHHPLRSGGPHGGGFPWVAHLFPIRWNGSRVALPLPGVGSLVTFARRLGITDQDVGGRRNRRMRAALRRAFEPEPPWVYAAGHDHSLQVIADERLPYLVVSGAGNAGGLSPVEPVPGTLFARSATGYVRLEVLPRAAPRLVVVALDAQGHGREAFCTGLGGLPDARP